MNVAFVVFNKMTALDLIGIYDPLTRLGTMKILTDFEWRLCALTQEVRDDRGLLFSPDSVAESLGGFDLLIVPGGFGTRQLMHGTEFITWLGSAAQCKMKVSVCTGALLLGAAGFLQGKRATTHPNAFHELSPYCSEVIKARVVDEGEVVTGGGVTSALDVGLHVVERLAGREAREQIAKQMDYPYARKKRTGQSVLMREKS